MSEWLNNIFPCIKGIKPYGVFWDLLFSLNVNIPDILLCCCIVAMVHLFYCCIVFCSVKIAQLTHFSVGQLN